MRRAFTLIEILVVLGIIALLSALVVVGSGWAMRFARIRATQAVLVRVDAAILQFNEHFHALPFATWGGDPTQPLSAADAWSNDLFWRLGSAMTMADKTAANAATPAAVAAAEASVTTAEADTYKGGFVDNGVWRMWTGGSRNYQDAVVQLLKVVKSEAATTRVQRLHQRGDFLTIQDLGSKFLRPDPLSGNNDPAIIVDAWGKPLIYASRYAPPVPFRDITTLPGWSYRYDTDLVGMPTGARTSIVDTDNDGTIDDEAATSDIRTHAYPGFESGFELWSAGPDQRFHAVRGESVNRDNTTVTLYRKKP